MITEMADPLLGRDRMVAFLRQISAECAIRTSGYGIRRVSRVVTCAADQSRPHPSITLACPLAGPASPQGVAMVGQYTPVSGAPKESGRQV